MKFEQTPNIKNYPEGTSVELNPLQQEREKIEAGEMKHAQTGAPEMDTVDTSVTYLTNEQSMNERLDKIEMELIGADDAKKISLETERERLMQQKAHNAQIGQN